MRQQEHELLQLRGALEESGRQLAAAGECKWQHAAEGGCKWQRAAAGGCLIGASGS